MQFRMSHEVIIERLSEVSFPKKTEDLISADNNDILTEIQILGNLIDKVLHPPQNSIVFPISPLSSLSTDDPSDSHQLLTQVRQALQDDRIEMWLQPIVSLPQRNPDILNAMHAFVQKITLF